MDVKNAIKCKKYDFGKAKTVQNWVIGKSTTIAL